MRLMVCRTIICRRLATWFETADFLFIFTIAFFRVNPSYRNFYPLYLNWGVVAKSGYVARKLSLHLLGKGGFCFYVETF